VHLIGFDAQKDRQKNFAEGSTALEGSDATLTRALTSRNCKETVCDLVKIEQRPSRQRPFSHKLISAKGPTRTSDRKRTSGGGFHAARTHDFIKVTRPQVDYHHPNDV